MQNQTEKMQVLKKKLMFEMKYAQLRNFRRELLLGSVVKLTDEVIAQALVQAGTEIL